MKRVIAISFLLLLFFSQTGSRFIYLIQQHEAKEAAEKQLLAGIPESYLEVIDFANNKNNIEWEEEGKEFFLHGQMYDVARINQVNGKMLIYCFNDKKEKQVLQDLSKSVKAAADQDTSNKNGKQTIKFQLTDLFVFSENINITERKVSGKYTDHDVVLVSSTKNIITPPPKFLYNA